MKIKIVINTADENGEPMARSEIWEGELEILDKNEYLTLISIIAEGKEHPVCQIPFSLHVGWYEWHPPKERIIPQDIEFEPRDF